MHQEPQRSEKPDAPSAGEATPLAWFGAMIDHCYDFAEAAKTAAPAKKEKKGAGQ